MSFDNYEFDNSKMAAGPAAPVQQSQGAAQGNNNYQRNNYQGGGGGGYGGGNRGFNRGAPKEEMLPIYYKPYVLTGNDNAPESVIEQLKKIATDLQKAGYTMRNRGMKGVEDTLERHVNDKEIHLPWKGFDNKESKHTWTPPVAKDLAAQVQNGFEGLKPVIQTFLAANVRMIMGKDLKAPAMFMLLWTEDGAEIPAQASPRTGNSRHAIAVAYKIGMPVFNIQNPDALERLKKHTHLLDFSDTPPDAAQQSTSSY